MDALSKQEHADLLRKAIEESGVSRQALADLLGRTYRTVGYWTSHANPTMPSGEERAKLRKVLGDYDAPGDEVERALRRSGLVEWRQAAVLTEYKRQLHQQDAEAV
jgi:hypothetical protein